MHWGAHQCNNNHLHACQFDTTTARQSQSLKSDHHSTNRTAPPPASDSGFTLRTAQHRAAHHRASLAGLRGETRFLAASTPSFPSRKSLRFFTHSAGLTHTFSTDSRSLSARSIHFTSLHSSYPSFQFTCSKASSQWASDFLDKHYIHRRFATACDIHHSSVHPHQHLSAHTSHSRVTAGRAYLLS